MDPGEVVEDRGHPFDLAPPSVIQWGQVRTARVEGQARLLEVVAIISQSVKPPLRRT